MQPDIWEEKEIKENEKAKSDGESIQDIVVTIDPSKLYYVVVTDWMDFGKIYSFPPTRSQYFTYNSTNSVLLSY